jgi:hypothetical protein
MTTKEKPRRFNTLSTMARAGAVWYWRSLIPLADLQKRQISKNAGFILSILSI